MPAQQISHRRRAALVVHRRQLQPRHAFEQHHVDVARAAKPDRGVVQLAGLRPRMRHHLRQRLEWRRRRNHENLVRQAIAADRREVLHVVGQLGQDVRIDGEGLHAGGEQRVAVRRGFRDQIGGDLRGAAGAVLNDDWLAPQRAEPRRDRARDVVHRAAGRIRDDDADLLGRKALRLRNHCAQRQARGNERCFHGRGHSQLHRIVAGKRHIRHPHMGLPSSPEAQIVCASCRVKERKRRVKQKGPHDG